MEFQTLPQSVLNGIISEWVCNAGDICSLDIALCNRSARKRYVQAIKGCVVHVPGAFKPTEAFFYWLRIRSASFNQLCIHIQSNVRTRLLERMAITLPEVFTGVSVVTIEGHFTDSDDLTKSCRRVLYTLTGLHTMECDAIIKDQDHHVVTNPPWTCLPNPQLLQRLSLALLDHTLQDSDALTSLAATIPNLTDLSWQHCMLDPQTLLTLSLPYSGGLKRLVLSPFEPQVYTPQVTLSSPPHLCFPHLTSLDYHHISGVPGSLPLLSLLLEHSPCLESLILGTAPLNAAVTAQLFEPRLWTRLRCFQSADPHFLETLPTPFPRYTESVQLRELVVQCTSSAALLQGEALLTQCQQLRRLEVSSFDPDAAMRCDEEVQHLFLRLLSQSLGNLRSLRVQALDLVSGCVWEALLQHPCLHSLALHTVARPETLCTSSRTSSSLRHLTLGLPSSPDSQTSAAHMRVLVAQLGALQLQSLTLQRVPLTDELLLALLQQLPQLHSLSLEHPRLTQITPLLHGVTAQTWQSLGARSLHLRLQHVSGLSYEGLRGLLLHCAPVAVTLQRCRVLHGAGLLSAQEIRVMTHREVFARRLQVIGPVHDPRDVE